jgi:hypothetical protein
LWSSITRTFLGRLVTIVGPAFVGPALARTGALRVTAGAFRFGAFRFVLGAARPLQLRLERLQLTLQA